MPAFFEHARALAGALRELPGISVVPDPPQTPLFHVHLRGDRDLLWGRFLDLAQTHRVWLANRLEPSAVPHISKLEINVGAPALEISPGEAAALFVRILET